MLVKGAWLSFLCWKWQDEDAVGVCSLDNQGAVRCDEELDPRKSLLQPLADLPLPRWVQVGFHFINENNAGFRHYPMMPGILLKQPI